MSTGRRCTSVCPVEGSDQTLTSHDGGSDEGGALPSKLDDRYTLHELLGEGEGGRVFRAYDRELQRHVAIKLLAGVEEEAAARTTRFRREARAHALLQHPNVVSIFDVGEDEGQVFIAMEFVEGASLKDWLSESPAVDAILRAFLEAGLGLQAAHEKGLVHRDFKPSNVLIGKDGRARVADFGLARGESSNEDEFVGSTGRSADLSLTQTGTVLGTPAYMAPEQRRGEPVDARADQYAFCLSLLEALIGSGSERRGRPNSSNFPTAEKVKAKTVPKRLRDVLAKGLAEQVEDRHDSLAPVLHAVRTQLNTSSSLRTTAIVGALVVAASVGFVAYQRATACSDLASVLDPVWDPSRSRRMASTLDSLVPGRLFETIDAYARRWVDARVEVCEATRLRGDQSEKLMDARVDCLDRRLDALDVLLTLTEAGRTGDVAETQASISRLPDPRACVDLSSSSTEAPAAPPGMEDKLSRLEALMATGLLREGLDEAAALVKSSTAGPAYWQAEARSWLARYQSRLDQSEEAMRSWESTAALAERAAHDRLRFDAYIEQIVLDQGETVHQPRVDRTLTRAKAVLQRMGGGARSAARLAAVEARILKNRGDLVGCRSAGEEAVALLAAADAALFDKLAAYQVLLECMISRGDRREAVEVSERAIREAREALGPNHPFLVGLESQLSRAHDFSGNREEAEAAARRALEIALRSLGPGHTATGEAYQSLANAQFRTGEFAKGAENTKRALDIETQVNGRTIRAGILTSSYALFLDRAGELDRSLVEHDRAVALLQELAGANHPATGAARGRRGSVLQQKGRHNEALEGCRRARQILASSDPMHARILDQVRCMAISLLALDRPAEALEVLRDGLRISEHRDEPAFYTSFLEFLTAKASWRIGERQEAVRLAESAAARLRAESVRPRALEEIENWLASPR